MMRRVVAVSGTRNPDSRRGVISAALAALDPQPDMVVVGDAAGVDAEAHEWALMHGVTPVRIGALWNWYREKGNVRRAGPHRNNRLAQVAHALGADLLLAVPDSDSVGTYSCICECAKVGIGHQRC